MSCAGNGYLSGNVLVPFPFEDGQCLCWEDQDRKAELQQALQRCFVDAGVCVYGNFGGWPSIGSFDVSGGTLYFSVAVGDDEVRLSVSGSSRTRFPIVSGNAPWGSYVVVMSSDGVSDFCSISPPSRVFTRSSATGREGCYLRLCPKCVTIASTGLSSIRVFDGHHEFSEGPHFSLVGDVLLKPGNNMAFGEVDGDESAVELSAEPGSGLGSLPCECSDSIGNPAISGPDGHTRIFNDTCYDIEPSTTTGTLQMHVKCTACCTCKMYESIVNERLVGLANAVRGARGEIGRIHDKYEAAVREFNERISRPSIKDVSMTLTGMPVGSRISPKISNKDVKGRMERCVFTAIVVNSSFFKVSANVNSIHSSGEIVESSAAWSDAGGSPMSRSGDSGRDVMGTYDIYPGRSLVVNLVVSNSRMVRQVVTGGYSADISAKVSWNGMSIGTLMKRAEV